MIDPGRCDEMSGSGQALHSVCRQALSKVGFDLKADLIPTTDPGGACFSPSVTEPRSMAMQDQVNVNPKPKRVP